MVGAINSELNMSLPLVVDKIISTFHDNWSTITKVNAQKPSAYEQQ